LQEKTYSLNAKQPVTTGKAPRWLLMVALFYASMCHVKFLRRQQVPYVLKMDAVEKELRVRWMMSE